MAGSTGGTGSSNPLTNPSAPKILLAKPSAGPVPGKFGRGGAEDETAAHRSRLPPVGSLNLLSDSWEFHIDRFLPFLTENTDFTVVGIIGPPGVGKSTIMNELYGFDGISPGMLPPFAIQSEDTRAMARHCTVGIEPRISAERLILLDTQSVFSPSVLSEIMRPDGSSTVSVLSGEAISAELAHEIMNIQVDLLKHGIPDPSSMTPLHSQNSTAGPDKEFKEKVHEGEEYMTTPVFVHTKLQDQDLSPSNIVQIKKALLHYFSSTSFTRRKCGNKATDLSSMAQSNAKDPAMLNFFAIPYKNKDDLPRDECESYVSSLWKLRDQVLSMNCPPFTKNVSERDWLKNSAKIWELVKSSPIIAEYSKTLLSSGPTSFAPIINAAIDIVDRSNGQYHVLVIVADGQVTRNPDTPRGRLSPQEQETVDSIVAASHYPLSIILVGVGDGPWDSMQQFDDNIPQRAFDNFQFVNFTKIMSENTDISKKEAAFALAALMEIPYQYRATLNIRYENRELVGGNPRPLPPPQEVIDHDNAVNSMRHTRNHEILAPTAPTEPVVGSSAEPVIDLQGLRGVDFIMSNVPAADNNTPETVRQFEEGLRGSWHPGVVVGVSNLSRSIKYDELLSETGKSKLIESIPVTEAIEGLHSRRHIPSTYRGHIRPLPPPSQTHLNQKLGFGVCVDALYEDAWWEGVILDNDDNASERSVYFPDEADECKISVSQLRVSLEWDEYMGIWRDRGVWVLVQLAKELEGDIPLACSVKKVWSSVRLNYGFIKMISEWTCGVRTTWRKYFMEVVQEIAFGSSRRNLANRKILAWIVGKKAKSRHAGKLSSLFFIKGEDPR
ncbi:hypothetical protein COLO4_35796 [Corchorus olitorius]|uniref:Agenet domain-containing protein n=1 Tax=Corchorus olitorius TaxID=93759 RepID=A0A1R3GDF6_9ROSI|nr:hypothetical protein COLO4_35796 [Corchorus olitorius]